MSMIETLSDEKNSFLSRREIICDFKGLGGKLKKLEAVEMITKEFKLDGKIVIPMKLQNRTGQPKITGIFYVYDDEWLQSPNFIIGFAIFCTGWFINFYHDSVLINLSNLLYYLMIFSQFCKF